MAKAEWTTGEANPRFIVTSLPSECIDARTLYEAIYFARGDMENRIKECQLDLYADRTSAATMRANQLRLWFASVAYVLMCALRRIGLKGTELARATCGTIRFFEISQDYQILCNLTHENLEACGQTIEELRRRLTGNIHYTVLAKLDEVHALVEANLAGK